LCGFRSAATLWRRPEAVPLGFLKARPVAIQSLLDSSYRATLDLHHADLQSPGEVPNIDCKLRTLQKFCLVAC
jgi:hypothetical protein